MTVDSWCIGRPRVSRKARSSSRERSERSRPGPGAAHRGALQRGRAQRRGRSPAPAARRRLRCSSRRATPASTIASDRARIPLRGVRQRAEGETGWAPLHAAAAAPRLRQGRAGGVCSRARDRWLDDGVERTWRPARQRSSAGERPDRGARPARARAGLQESSIATPRRPATASCGSASSPSPIRSARAWATPSRACRAAGIRTMLLTGDQRRTAAAICRELGLGGRRTVWCSTPARVDELVPRRCAALVREVDVFARVSPADKYRDRARAAGRRRHRRDDRRRHQRRRRAAGGRRRRGHGRSAAPTWRAMSPTWC